MPNLTSYRPQAIHLYRELPKSPCDLLRHEVDYGNFLRTRIAQIRSTISAKSSKNDQNKKPMKYYDENNQKYPHISHFRLRQMRWKDQIEKENQRFIRSLVSRQQNYRPRYDRSIVDHDYQQHLKLIHSMSHYPPYHRQQPRNQDLFNHLHLPRSVFYNFPQFYPQHSKALLQEFCRALPTSYYRRTRMKSTKEKKKRSYSPAILSKTTHDAIKIYNQPLPSAPKRLPKFSDQQKSASRPTPSNSYRLWLKSEHEREALPDHLIEKDVANIDAHVISPSVV